MSENNYFKTEKYINTYYHDYKITITDKTNGKYSSYTFNPAIQNNKTIQIDISHMKKCSPVLYEFKMDVIPSFCEAVFKVPLQVKFELRDGYSEDILYLKALIEARKYINIFEY